MNISWAHVVSYWARCAVVVSYGREARGTISGTDWFETALCDRDDCSRLTHGSENLPSELEYIGKTIIDLVPNLAYSV